MDKTQQVLCHVMLHAGERIVGCGQVHRVLSYAAKAVRGAFRMHPWLEQIVLPPQKKAIQSLRLRLHSGLR